MNMTGSSNGSRIDQTEIRFLIEKNADGIIVVDEGGTVLFANPAAEQIFGRTSGSLIGSPIGIPFVTSDATEITVHRPGDGPIDAEVRVVETSWDHRPARLASLRDISARRALEERLRHSAKMEAIGRLTAGIAHDFNNLLTVVLGNLESVQRRYANLDSRLVHALESAMRGAQQAAVLTERLLAFARRKPLEPRLLDLDAIVRRMSDLLQRTLGERIIVRAKIGANLWTVEADPTELEAAILNLAVNARDAMPSGGELSIETANVELAVDPEAVEGEAKAGPHVLISIADSGSGMTPDVLRHVFEPFFTTKTDGRGTGLGLSQVYGFAKQSGGYVKLCSQVDVGTTVKIFLPKAAAHLEMAESQISPPNNLAPVPEARAAETILVVEDDKGVRQYTVSSLRELGYIVFEAVDATVALDILRHQPDIHLLFTDLGLPGGIDGKSLAEQARLMRPLLRILITSAYADSSLIQEGRLAPDIDLLTKPFTFAALATRIREVLDANLGNEGAGAHILVVEDESLLQMFLVDELAQLGLPVETAASFKEALAKFQNRSEHLAAAVIDLGLPDRPGDELIPAIRALRPNLPVILTTGYAKDDVRARFAAYARLEILTKPFNSKDLLDVLKSFGIRSSNAH
ncbi:response regulator [Bradyrhizobium sp. Arg237L]|uniref:response regulator n=1 Tax=Bradyrhizobium sp. Arg237L TaxID=3003352 RepID=UPI00249DB9B6|nr:response regulator [Bradyrhizobium sp. Arg237L]MDI4237735.1 response regulator [Bradyrhizobium sp. Arg237L]